MKLSEKIVRLRKSRGMSQEALAEEMGVSRQAVSRWEVGSALPDASNLLQLSRIFGVSADYLLNDEYEDDRYAAPAGNRVAKGRAAKAAGLCLAGLGLLGNLAVYVLSRFIEVMVPHIVHENGQTWYTYSSGITARSYRYFIQEYKLEFLVVLLWMSAVLGFTAAFAPGAWFKRASDRLKSIWKARFGSAKDKQADAREE